VNEEGEKDLLVRAARGDVRAFGQIVDLHQAAVRGFLRRVTGHSHLADDIAQEAFVVAFVQLAGFRGQSSFRTYACGIAYRIWRGQNRSLRRMLQREAEYEDLRMIERPADMDLDLYLTLQQALRQLAPEQRAAVALCLGAEFSHAEAAQVLGLPLGTVKSHVTRGRQKLRGLLEGIAPDTSHSDDEHD
jgi:RNA polymerase sigma-70 factor (ECF subfamily)